ncbi:cytochrome P450 [Colletotrichum navitas]|uniref:Cytochrome P450 n=1 Tax=Colletotrichum navitas TaxID=681940 RepID=A0AAD8PKA2_9PEZI|nr:cytochrome P450 [Colletotrichum navitas]KAK1565840.1 cytochrome P450 [Colletotrichum navitas]
MADIIVTQTIITLIGLGLYYMFFRRPTGSPLPPGPRGLPIFGNVRDLPPSGKAEYQYWVKFKDTYGPVSSVTVAGQTIVLIHDEEAALHLLERNSIKTSNRPTQPFANDHCGFGVFLPALQYGPRFRQHRKLVHQVLGTTKSVSEFRNVQYVESRRFLFRILNTPNDLMTRAKTYAAAIILNIVYGYSIEVDTVDPLTNLVQLMMDKFSRAFVPMAWPVDVLPALNYLPEGFPFTSFKHVGRQWKRITTIAVDAPYLFVRKQMAHGTNRQSFVSSLVDDLGNSSENEINLSKEDEDAIKVSAAALYGGGADTTVSTISSFVLAMLMFPDVQKKAQMEIDSVFGPDRLPSFDDQPRLPYINALVKESLRWFPVVPIGTPHVTDTEIFYDRYRIPKNSYLLPSIWWFLHDPCVYKDPSSFDPDRFLEPRNEPDPGAHAFGYGRRICPGRYLAIESLYITLSRMLAFFNVQKAVDDQGRDIEPQFHATPGLVSHLGNFSFTVSLRSEKYARLIWAVETEHPWAASDSKLLDGDLIEESISLSREHI